MKKLSWIFLLCILITTNDITTYSDDRPPKLDFVGTINIESNEL